MCVLLRPTLPDMKGKRKEKRLKKKTRRLDQEEGEI